MIDRVEFDSVSPADRREMVRIINADLGHFRRRRLQSGHYVVHGPSLPLTVSNQAIPAEEAATLFWDKVDRQDPKLSCEDARILTARQHPALAAMAGIELITEGDVE